VAFAALRLLGAFLSVGRQGGSVPVALPCAVGSLAGKVMSTALSTFSSFLTFFPLLPVLFGYVIAASCACVLTAQHKLWFPVEERTDFGW
jgi:hypothetical protein